jgi:hypothetical protein
LETGFTQVNLVNVFILCTWQVLHTTEEHYDCVHSQYFPPTDSLLVIFRKNTENNLQKREKTVSGLVGPMTINNYIRHIDKVEPEEVDVCYDVGRKRPEVEETKQRLRTEDGTTLTVKTTRWRRGETQVFIEAVKHNIRVYTHQPATVTGDRMRKFHVEHDNGIIFTFTGLVESSRTLPTARYSLNISWPNNLCIELILDWDFIDTYVKQERQDGEEVSRCCLRNGQVVVRYANGNTRVMGAGGETWMCYDYNKHEEKFQVVDYDFTNSFGELWTRSTKNHTSRLSDKYTILQGVDSKTGDTFYRRSDGCKFMLWSDGTLVTSYPDGTRITSTPMFLEDIHQIHERSISKTVVFSCDDKHFSTTVSSKKVVCSYLMEHPNYAGVSFTPSGGPIRLFMPGNTEVLIHECGKYELYLQNIRITVDDVIKMSSPCSVDTATVTFNFNHGEDLCKLIDQDPPCYVVKGDGTVTTEDEVVDEPDEAMSTKQVCVIYGYDNASPAKYFVLQRDMSGRFI